MLFEDKLRLLKEELNALPLDEITFIQFLNKCKQVLLEYFSAVSKVIIRLKNISTKPKTAYFPEMQSKIYALTLGECKEELFQVLEFSLLEFEKNISNDSIMELLQREESQNLEFKSTLCWDIVNSKADKKMMGEVIMKSISALSNSDGGVLIIGISDNKKLLGLFDDYKVFKNGSGNRDDFELHLTTLLINNFSKTFAKDNLKIEFPIIENKDICLIRVKKGEVPYTINVTDKKGLNKEKFFIRINNSSREIDNLLEFASYVKRKFPDWN